LRPEESERKRLDTTRTVKKIIAGALLSGGAVAGFGLAPGTAEAHPGFMPPMHGPLPGGDPWTWCPGDPMSGTNSRNNHGGPGLDVQ
jgi:hypothetical protein